MKTILFMFLLMHSTWVSAQCALNGPRYYVVSSSDLYEHMSTASAVVGRVEKGDSVWVEESFFGESGWWQVCYKLKPGWIKKKHLSSKRPATQNKKNTQQEFTPPKAEKTNEYSHKENARSKDGSSNLAWDYNRERFYDSLSNKYDLGSYPKFCVKLENSNKKLSLYRNVALEHDLGTYEEFCDRMSASYLLWQKTRDNGGYDKTFRHFYAVYSDSLTLYILYANIREGGYSKTFEGFLSEYFPEKILFRQKTDCPIPPTNNINVLTVLCLTLSAICIILIYLLLKLRMQFKQKIKLL